MSRWSSSSLRFSSSRLLFAGPQNQRDNEINPANIIDPNSRVLRLRARPTSPHPYASLTSLLYADIGPEPRGPARDRVRSPTPFQTSVLPIRSPSSSEQVVSRSPSSAGRRSSGGQSEEWEGFSDTQEEASRRPGSSSPMQVKQTAPLP